MKIFFIDPNNTTAQVNYPLLEKLLMKNFKVLYLSSFNRWNSDYYEQNYQVNSKYIFFNYANRIKNQKLRQIAKGISYPLNLLKLIVIVCIGKPDILHFNNVTIPLFDFFAFVLFKTLKYRIIITQHNFKEHDKKKVSKYKLKCFNKVDKIICLSDFNKKQFPDHLKSKIEVIKHGNVYEKEIEKYAIKGLKKNKRLIYKLLFIGLIRPYKGLENLIDAYKSLPEDFKNTVQLEIVGNALNKNYLKELKIKQDGCLNIQICDKYLEYSEMVSIIQSSDVGVLPYISATQSGIPYLFASLNKPIIITNVGALPEQVFSDFAEICEPKIESMAQAVENIIYRIKNNKILNKDFERFNTENSLKIIIEDYMNVYYYLNNKKYF